MGRVNVWLDERTVKQLDERSRASGQTRSEFIADAVTRALELALSMETLAKERQHRLGYERFPIEPGEFDLEPDDERWPEW